MTAAALHALLSHWRRKPFQLVTLVLGLALSTALWAGVQAINAEARKSYDDAANVLGGSQVIVDSAGAQIAPDAYATLRRNGWKVSPIVDGWVAGSEGRVRLLGIDPLTLSPGTPTRGALEDIELTDFLGSQGRILTSPATATRLENFGARVQKVEGLAPGLALVDLSGAAALLEQSGYDRLELHAEQPLSQTPLKEIGPSLIIEAPDSAGDLTRLTDSFHLNLTAFGLLSFAVGLFIVNGAVGLAFEQRRPVFRTLRALGVPARNLVFLLVVELLILALIAGAIGVVLGYFIAAFLLPDVAATLRGLYGATIDGALTLSPLWWLSGLAIAILGTALAALTHLVQVARLKPLAAAQPRAWALASESVMRMQLIVATLCLATSLFAGLVGGGLVGGFVLLAGLLLAAALALPTALSIILRGAERLSRGVLSEWFWADTRQQLPGLSLALMALLLALAANIGVGTMVGSFRLTFTGWLDQRLASELYVTAESEAEVADLIAFLEPRTDAILPIWHTDAEVLGAPAEIYGIVDHPTYRENWPLLSALPNVWDRIAIGEGALINEQLGRREDIAPGDVIAMPGGWETEVLGVYSDYGNPMGQVILPTSTLTTRYSDIDRTDFGLRVSRGNVDAVRTSLTEDFGLPAENIIDQASIKSFSIDVFDRTFAVSAALNVLTLAVAGFAILTSLLTIAAMRLPQLAPIWALGIPRHILARAELIRALILAAVTFVLAVPVGLLLAWVLLAVINVEAFGWRLPMHFFPADWAWLALLSLLAAGLASLWPARRLATRPPADLIRVFSHER